MSVLNSAFLTTFTAVEFREIISDELRQQLLQLLPPQVEPQQEDELLSIAQVTKLFGVSRTTILDWRKKGLLKSVTLRRRVFFIKSSLIEYLNSKNKKLGDL